MSAKSESAKPDATAIGALRRQTVPWGTVLVVSGLMAFSDGFWLTSLEGAIGAVERTLDPVGSWLRVSTLMLPVFVLAVLWALRRTHRVWGPAPKTTRAVVAATLLIAAAGTVVGVAALVANSMSNYGVQVLELRRAESTHFHVATSAPREAVGTCTATCRAERATLAVHVRGVAYASGVLLATNLVVVGWVVALRGGSLTVSPRRVAPTD